MILIPKIRANVLIYDQATGQSINFIYSSTVMLHTSPSEVYENCLMLQVSQNGQVMAEFGPFTDFGVEETEVGVTVIALVLKAEGLEPVDSDEDYDVLVEIYGDEDNYL
jgi:hypothetical protein